VINDSHDDEDEPETSFEEDDFARNEQEFSDPSELKSKMKE
jgi:hypothetical protein